MSRYIDADELLKRLSRKEADEGAALVNFVKKVVELRIESMPTADVQEIKRGRWIVRQLPMPLSDGSMECVECSVCHTHWDGGTNYCPNCGASMQGEEE